MQQRGGHRLCLHGLRAHDLRWPNWCASPDRHGCEPALLCTACPDSARRAHDGATRAAPRRGQSLPSLLVSLCHTIKPTEHRSATAHIPRAPSYICGLAGATFGAPGKTSAPSSSASCSCCYLASWCSSTSTTSVRLVQTP